jgi:hypothetical protein
MTRLLPAVCSLFALVVATTALAAPLRYTTTWRDATGKQRDITVDGSVERGTVAGTVRVDEIEFSLSGVVAIDGSVSGAVRGANGTPVATFAGRVDRDGVLKGSLTAKGRTLPWSAPGVVLPSPTAQ